MLKLLLPDVELYNSDTAEFIYLDEVVVSLEHSLVSLSKWESIWEKPFLDGKERTPDEFLSYVECMVLDEDFNPLDLTRLTAEHFSEIDKYLQAKKTATWFSSEPKKSRTREVLTSELIYYWMFSAGIDISCQDWHLNRLFTLIRVFDAKNQKEEKRPRSESFAERRRLNAERKARLGTSG